MLEIKCDICGKQLREPGALVFSPPTDKSWTVEKYHVCAKCWLTIASLLKGQKPKP